MNENLSAVLDRILDKPVGQPEILLGVLLIVIVQINVQVLKVLVSLCVLLGSDVEHMRDSQIEQVLSLQAGDKIAIAQLRQNLDRVKTL